MKIMVGVAHPKHVHFRKNVIKNLIDRGHDVKVVARDKDITLRLLQAYGFKYDLIGSHYKTLPKKIYGVLETDVKAYKIAASFKPDLLVGGSPYLSHVAKILGKPHICFSDTENTPFNNWILYSCSDLVCTPCSFKDKLNPHKHLKYNGYEELAYLHPDYFKPDPTICESLGLLKDEKYIIVRFVGWDATHDRGAQGFHNKLDAIKKLEQYARVFITSERKLHPELESYRISIPPEKMHDFMYYASLFIGESSSMACESALLGTPSIFISTSRRGYTDELEVKYELLYNYSDPISGQKDALDKAIKLLEDPKSKMKWGAKRDKLIRENINVVEFITSLIDSYPTGLKELREITKDYDCNSKQ